MSLYTIELTSSKVQTRLVCVGSFAVLVLPIAVPGGVVVVPVGELLVVVAEIGITDCCSVGA